MIHNFQPIRFSAIGIIFITSATWAAPGEDRFPISIADAEAKFQTHFETIDADRSGTVDLNELEAAKMPRRHHGATHNHRRHAKHAHPRGHGKSGGYSWRDAGPERSERRAAMEAETFTILDTDGSGSLSPEEYGSNNRQEARQLARKRIAFKYMDANEDNLLSIDEMPNPLKRLRAADADNDGLVSKAEMKAQRRAWRESRRTRQAG